MADTIELNLRARILCYLFYNYLAERKSKEANSNATLIIHTNNVTVVVTSADECST